VKLIVHLATAFFFVCIFDLRASGSAANGPLKFCSGVGDFSASPARPLKFGLEINLLLLLTRPIISDSKNNPGVLSAWHFDSTRNVLTGRLASNMKWPDGAEVTSVDVAYSIAYGIANRMIGENIRVVGAQKGEPIAFPLNSILVKNNNEFELRFESKVQNPKGAIIEALSVNSRPNRIWVGRFDSRMKTFSEKELVSKQEKFRFEIGRMGFSVEKTPIQVELTRLLHS
jgi:hypothetical protein